MIPVGNYKARATRGQWGRSKTKGTIMCAVSFVITDGEHKGASVSWFGYFEGKAKDRSVESLRHCGCTFPGDNITDLAGLDSREVEIVTEIETWEKDGEPQQRARVAWVNAIGGIPESQLLDDAGKAAFAASMKGLLVAARKKASPNGAAKERPAREPEEDSIPF